MPNEFASLDVRHGMQVGVLSETTPDFDICVPAVEPHPRRAIARCQRPTALMTGRNRSESPATRSKSRPSDLSVSSPIDENALCDPESLQTELEKKSGMLVFGVQSLSAKMDDFISECLLGSGTCSEVYKMRHRTKPELVMAVKHMRRSSTCPEENKRIMRDLYVVTKCNDCEYIVHCFGIFLTASDVWICMEIMSTCLDKLLRDLHRPFPEKVLGKVTVSITTALDYLKRKHNVMHRDVKPSNMLLSYEGIVKLCDFGISGELKDSIARSRQLGCIGYMAPERLESSSYDVRADVWSLGISLLELATGSFPYKGTEIEFAIMSKIISEPPPSLPHHIPCSSAFRHFIDLCLKKDHRQRPKYHALMNTDFFRRHNVPPRHVLDWLQCIPLNYLHRPNSPSPTHRADPNSPAASSSPSLNSPLSNSTVSPDLSQALSSVSLGDSFEQKAAENRCDAQNGLDIVVVAAPAVNVYPPLRHEHKNEHANDINSNNNITLGSVTRDLSLMSAQPVVSHGSSIYHPPSTVSGTRVGMGHTAASSAQSHEPLSHASSGYGSAGSEGSPGSVINIVRPITKEVNEARHLHSISTQRFRGQVLTSGNEAHPSSTCSSGQSDSSNRILQIPQVNLNGSTGTSIYHCIDPVSHVHSDHWSTTASSSRIRTQRNSATKYPAVPNSVTPLIKKFEPDRCVDSSRFGFSRPGTEGATEHSARSFTPPLTGNRIVDPVCASSTLVDRSARQDVQRPLYSQVRSASVGRNLHRSHAQRWPSRPQLYNKVPPMIFKANMGLVRNQPPGPEAVAVPCVPTIGQSGVTDSQQYHHHYFHYYHHRHNETANQDLRKIQNLSPSRDQILTNPAATIHDNPSHPNRSVSYSNGTRLAHRLLTHPIPAQTTAMSKDLPLRPKKQSNSLSNGQLSYPSPLSFRQPLESISKMESPSVHSRIPRFSQGSCQDEPYSRFSQRSSSQPAVVNLRNTSFETDL
ncbi:hypothetical protein CRM22_009296 [Opisthorchis felineus]|uniref:mitogen-activated protein kinase kinase n=1 Tax=Opisthorchis felineus TaxID=147828 RepID=A0A4S2LFC3_OPIFE|nr:hypothetical protein CRM22_009296 [Opisthorchis felineus]